MVISTISQKQKKIVYFSFFSKQNASLRIKKIQNGSFWRGGGVSADHYLGNPRDKLFLLLRNIVKGESITFPQLTSEDTAIETKYEVTDLGVLMSSSGSFKRHVEEIIKKARERFSWISRVLLTQDPEPMHI